MSRSVSYKYLRTRPGSTSLHPRRRRPRRPSERSRARQNRDAEPRVPKKKTVEKMAMSRTNLARGSVRGGRGPGGRGRATCPARLRSLPVARRRTAPPAPRCRRPTRRRRASSRGARPAARATRRCCLPAPREAQRRQRESSSLQGPRARHCPATGASSSTATRARIRRQAPLVRAPCLLRALRLEPPAVRQRAATATGDHIAHDVDKRPNLLSWYMESAIGASS